MALFKLKRDWKGFKEGQIINVCSQDRLQAMFGDSVNPPVGEPFIPDKDYDGNADPNNLTMNDKPKPKPGKKTKSTTSKEQKGIEDESNTEENLDESKTGDSSEPDGISSGSPNPEGGSTTSGAETNLQ